MMHQLPKSSVTWLALALAMLSSGEAAEPDRATGFAYFEKQIRPILAEHCYACHSERAGKRNGGLLLDRRAGWVAGGDSGPAIVPGDVGASLLIQAIRYTDPKLQMPPDKALPHEAIARLEHWVQMGAPDPRGPPTLQGTRSESASDPIAGKSHWAFRPLLPQVPPVVTDKNWPRSALDHFILARLESTDLRPAPDSDPRDLVRRLYFQLIGLPPTPHQVDAFLVDKRSDALARLVDSLLNSPQFGERWGRHWLDLARYADSNGLDENFLFREAWRYRNWVIEAVNRDLPFDRFVLEQIAGDALPFESVEQRDRQRIAAGFLVVGPKVLLGNDEKKQRMEIADEQIDTIGRAILGQTLGCARCHDHKFDPVPTADYYALAGILTSTQVMERRYMLGEQRVMERLVGLGPEGELLDGAYEKYWQERPRRKEEAERAKSALELLKKSDEPAFQALLEKFPAAVAKAAEDRTQLMEQRIAAQSILLAELEAALAKKPEIPPRAMVPTESEAPADEPIRLAGQFDRLGKPVPRGFLQVLQSDSAREIPATRSGRLELSAWLTNVHHGAGRLAARVAVNRIWQQLVGRGIVRTVDNFGRTGEPPSHPELLDYLAGVLIDSGWSLKAVVREIVLSRTFAMSSDYEERGQAIDPDNRLLWRAHRRRLDPEALRDAMLAAAGQLDLAPMASSVWYLGDQATGVGINARRRTDFPCRSIYLPVIRNDLPELFEAFDFADPHATTGQRPETTVATQGLFVLNNDLVMDAAAATAHRLLSEFKSGHSAVLVDKMFELILNLVPGEEERDALLTFILEAENRFTAEGDSDPELRAWSMACHALFASSRFHMLE